MRFVVGFFAGCIIAATGTACGLIAWASRDIRHHH